MRFVQFLHNDRRCLGIEKTDGGDIVNLTEADPTLPSDLRTFIEGGESLLTEARRLASSGAHVVSRSAVKLLAPISRCEKVLCVGLNYIDHCKEHNYPIPEEPIIFNKFSTCIIGPQDQLPHPDETQCLDWEAELAFVVGKEAKNISVAEAMDYVFGYTSANDLNARDWQDKNGGQCLLATAFDGFCPLGPAVVTREDIADPHNLGVKCRVNGQLKQDGNTSSLIHKIPQIIAFITRFMTLKPGDVILTGTPPGVGCFRKPPEFLERGDVVEVEVDKIGTITTSIV